ncbi:MAG: RecB family exonuclease [Acidimicrobiia bacterium]
MTTLSQVPEGESLGVSATLFVTYRRCPQQALARLHGVYPEPSVASFKGALAHRLIARHLEDGPIDEAELPLVCRKETGANLNGQMAAIGLKPSEFGAVVSEVSDIYARFVSHPLADEGPVAAEVSFANEVSDGITLKGRIDAVYGSGQDARIVDWKTGANLGDDVDTQLAFYALAWKYQTGSVPKATEAISLATGERVAAAPTDADVEAVEHDVATMVAQLRTAMASSTELERVAGPYCRWCPLLDDCTEGAAAVSLLD